MTRRIDIAIERLQLRVGSATLCLLRQLLRGRPMVYVCPCFWDDDKGTGVYLFLDMRSGSYWMAHSKWAWSRRRCLDPNVWLRPVGGL